LVRLAATGRLPESFEGVVVGARATFVVVALVDVGMRVKCARHARRLQTGDSVRVSLRNRNSSLDATLLA
jgi:hypothetical protein